MISEEHEVKLLQNLAAQVVDVCPVALLIVDEQLRCLSINAAAVSIGDMSLQEAKGRTLDDVLPTLAGKLRLILKTTFDSYVAFNNISVTEEATSDARRRKRYSVSVNAIGMKPQEHARPALVAVTLIEDPWSDEAEAALRDREALFHQIFEHAPVAMLVLEWRGGAVRMNTALCEMLGYSAEELARMGIEEISHPDDFARDRDEFARLMRGEIDGYQMAKRYIRKNGSLVWADLDVSLVRDVAGLPVFVIASMLDISERRKHEDEQKRLIGELEESVRKREVFLSVASHELKTPLTPLQLNLQMLSRKIEKAGITEQPAELDHALRQCARLSTLVDALLDVSRIDINRTLAQTRVPIDLGDLARGVVDRFQTEANMVGSKLTLVADEPVMVRADPVRMDQVLANLLSNALKFGVGRPVEVFVENGEGVVRMRVHDEGFGINSEDRERIFERYERAVSEKHYGGLGLGLYIAKHIVDAHRGRISIESEPGKGTTFVVELPNSAN